MFEAEPLEKRLELVKSVDFQFKAENGHTFGIVWDKDAHKLSVSLNQHIFVTFLKGRCRCSHRR